MGKMAGKSTHVFVICVYAIMYYEKSEVWQIYLSQFICTILRQSIICLSLITKLSLDFFNYFFQYSILLYYIILIPFSSALDTLLLFLFSISRFTSTCKELKNHDLTHKVINGRSRIHTHGIFLQRDPPS